MGFSANSPAASDAVSAITSRVWRSKPRAIRRTAAVTSISPIPATIAAVRQEWDRPRAGVITSASSSICSSASGSRVPSRITGTTPASGSSHLR